MSKAKGKRAIHPCGVYEVQKLHEKLTNIHFECRKKYEALKESHKELLGFVKKHCLYPTHEQAVDKKWLLWGFLRKGDGQLFEITAQEGAVCEMIERMLKNKYWVLNSVTIDKQFMLKKKKVKP